VVVENGDGSVESAEQPQGNGTIANNNETYIITNETDPNCTHKIQVFTKQGSAVADEGSNSASAAAGTSGSGNGKEGATATSVAEDDIVIVKDNGNVVETVSQNSVEGNGPVVTPATSE
jgi:hypothetical protein